MCFCWDFDDPDDHRNSVRRTRGCALVVMTAGLSILAVGIGLAVEFAQYYKTDKEWTIHLAVGLIVGGLAVFFLGIALCCFVQKYLSAEWGQLRIKMLPKKGKNSKSVAESSP